MHKKFKIILSIIYIVILIIAFYLAKVVFINGQTIINGYSMYVVQSGSMSPTIKIGSLILVKDVHYSQINEGDIITYRAKSSNNIITHRVVDIHKGTTVSYTTKGDANSTSDPLQVEQGQLLGKVIFWIPYIGAIFAFIKTELGFIVFIIIVFTVIMLPDLLSGCKKFNLLEIKKGGR